MIARCGAKYWPNTDGITIFECSMRAMLFCFCCKTFSEINKKSEDDIEVENRALCGARKN